MRSVQFFDTYAIVPAPILCYNWPKWYAEGDHPISRLGDIQKLITNHQRRWQKLRESQVFMGYNTDAAVLTEIEDIDAKLVGALSPLAVVWE